MIGHEKNFSQDGGVTPPISSSASAGKFRRMQALFSPHSGRTVIVPIDDSLIFGPAAGLENVYSKLELILQDPPEAILSFPGFFRAHPELLSGISGIVNLTASTTRSLHTRKAQIGVVQQAAQLGLEAVAVHVNISSRFESEMLSILGSVVHDCETFGMPLVAIMYPRSEADHGDNNYEELKRTNRKEYAELVAHAARVGVDLGADLIKTQYTGSRESFEHVVEACRPTPLVVAGGPALSPRAMLQMAYDVITAGASGVSFGRNVFSRRAPQPYVTALKAVVHNGLSVEEALSQLESMPDQ